MKYGAKQAKCVRIAFTVVRESAGAHLCVGSRSKFLCTCYCASDAVVWHKVF